MKKLIISARRQNNQAVFFRGYLDKRDMTEFQDLAADFSSYPKKTALDKIEFLKIFYEGLSDWKIEEITC